MRGAVLLLVLLLCPFLLAGKKSGLPSAPPRLAQVFMDSLANEEDIEFKCWQSALTRTEGVKSGLQALLPALRKTVPEPELTALGRQTDQLYKGLTDQNASASYQAYFQLRQTFLGVMNRYNYAFPPVLFVIQHDLESAIDAALANNRPEVDHELNELEMNYRAALQELTEWGLTPHQAVDFMATVPKAREALQDQARPELLLPALKNMQALFEQQRLHLTRH